MFTMDGRPWREMTMTTISTFRINVPQEFKLATRPQGVAARKVLLEALKQHGEIELDFAGSEPTPSFADECVGVLCRTVGWERFRHDVHFANLTEATKSLLRVVIQKRRRETQSSER